MNDTIRYQNKPLDFVRLLGKGKGGYSYLVTDGTRQYVAKKIHHEPSEFYDFGDDKFGAEVNAYKRLEKLDIQIPRLLEVNKAQEYLIKEYIEGDWPQISLPVVIFQRTCCWMSSIYPK